MDGIKAIDKDGELSKLLARVAEGEIGDAELQGLFDWTQRWLVLKAALEKGGITYKQLKQTLLGLEDNNQPAPEGKDQTPDPDEERDEPKPPPPEDRNQPAPDPENQDEPTKKKQKGHGRRGAKDYTGCQRKHIYPKDYRPGDPCPFCVNEPKGRLQKDKPSRPLTRLRLSGQAPINGTVYLGYPLCCGKCGARILPDWPADANRETYDASAKALIALMRHWYGVPSHRLERLQDHLGIPVPDSTQADLIREVARVAEPVFYAMYRKAALADLYIIDDTSARIQDVTVSAKKEPDLERMGIRVSGMIARLAEGDVHLYRVGNQHAGESLADLLAHRPPSMPPPLQMSDALSANTDHPFETIVAYCLQHSRQNFRKLEEKFPVICGKVLALFKAVYKNETYVKEQAMTPQQRLAYHQKHTKPVMTRLFRYLKKLAKSSVLEPGSDMRRAIRYVLKRKQELTRFLEIAGAPLDSNAIERGLKYAVNIRKNSMFYLNEISAYQASVIMSLAGTCTQQGINPLKYLTAVLENEEAVKADPEAWLPWVYKSRLGEQVG